MRDTLLLVLKDAFDELAAAEAGGNEQDIRHAERNFMAAAKGLAKRAPLLINAKEAPADEGGPLLSTAA